MEPEAFNALNFTEIQIPMPWGHTAGKQWGSPDGKPILAVHGWIDNSNSFDPIISFFPTDWHVVAIDLVGHGHSSSLPPGVIYDFNVFIVQIKLTADYLKWDNFSYIGHSLGGLLAIIFACYFPTRIKTIVSLDAIKLLTEPVTDPEMLRGNRKYLHMWEKLSPNGEDNFSRPMEKAIEIIVKGSFGSIDSKNAQILLKRGTRPAINQPGNVIFTRDKRLAILSHYYFAHEYYIALIRNFKSQLLIIKAKDGVNLENENIYKDILKLYREICPSFEYAVVEGTHHVHMMQPDSVAPLIIAFINKYHLNIAKSHL